MTKSIIILMMLLLFIVISFFTPLFSSVGLWVLNHLPIPEVYETPTSLIHNSATNDITNNNSTQQPHGAEDFDYAQLQLNLPHKPTAYVVLGGGLTEADENIRLQSLYNSNDPNLDQSSDAKNTQLVKRNSTADLINKESAEHKLNKHAANTVNHRLAANNIVLNQYSLNRMTTVYARYRQTPLPIIVTGVEAPWMRDWLAYYGINNVVTENASMNTCENARFTAKRLKLTDVYLITDAYHMARTRRQFALNNIRTVPIAAPMPMQKNWLKPKDNAQHSRRTLYELAAYARDVFAPQENCRSAQEVSFETLLRSRKPEEVKIF